MNFELGSAEVRPLLNRPPREIMSPYGSTPTKAPHDILAPTSYSNDVGKIVVYHVNKESCPKELLQVLYEEFDKELELGRTYPQEGPIGFDGFKDYYFYGDVFIGIIAPSDPNAVIAPDIEAARAGREWIDSVAGCYYVCSIYLLLLPSI